MHKNRNLDYNVILKTMNRFISSKPNSTTRKEFIESFNGILSVAEATRFWDRLLILGNVLQAVDKSHYKWLVNTEFFTAISIEKHFAQGMVLSSRGRIPGKKYIKEKKQTPIQIYPGWISTITI